jgi:outer membrane protein TolC
MKNKNPFIKEVRIGKHPDKVRFVFYPEGSQVPPYQIERKKDRLVVSFGTSLKMANTKVASPPPSGSKTTIEAKTEAPAMAAQQPTPESKPSETPSPAEPGKGPATLLNVDQLVEEALQNNPEILAARQKWEVFKEKIPQAYALPDPMLGLGIINLPTNFSFRKEDMTMKEISVSQMFPFPGKRPLMKEMAEKEAEAVYSEIQGKIQQVIKDVKAAYYELSHVYRATEVIRRNKEILETFARIAETRYSVGEGIQQDVIKAHVEVSKMVDELLMQNQKQRALEAKLNALLSRSPETLLGKPEEVVLRKIPHTLEELQQMALEMNPTLKGMKKMIEAKEKAYDLAKREYYPDFNFKFAYGQRDNGPDMKRRDMLTGMMEINIPIFYKSKQDRKVAETKADIMGTEAQYRAMKNEISFMIVDMTSMIHRVERQIELYKTGIIPQAGLQIASAMSAYRVNKADFMTLLDSQMTLYKYELEYHQALTEYDKNVATLGAVMGKQLFQRGEGK